MYQTPSTSLHSQSQAFILTVITLCFIGYLMVQMRATIQRINIEISNPKIIRLFSATDTGYINALFAGVVRPNPVLISPTVPGYIDALFAGNNVLGKCTHLSHHAAKMNVYRLIVDNVQKNLIYRLWLSYMKSHS